MVILRKHTVLERAQTFAHTHRVAQHDQLDGLGELTPVVAILDNRWEEKSTERDSERAEEKVPLPLSF